MIQMDNLDEIIKGLKNMDKSQRKELLNELSKNPDAMKQVSSLLQNSDIQKKLKDLLK